MQRSLLFLGCLLALLLTMSCLSNLRKVSPLENLEHVIMAFFAPVIDLILVLSAKKN